MPSKAPHPCSKCGKLITKQCECQTAAQQVQRVRYDQERGSAHSRGYTSRWAAYSKQYRRDHPLCVMCEEEGKITLAACVDHIKAVVNGQTDPLFWESTNHRGLCWMHHSHVTASQDGGFGNVKGKGKPRADCGVDGVPVDRRSHWNK